LPSGGSSSRRCHWVQQEAPEAVNEALLGFLAQL
jgi:hypothetical protein